MNKTIGAQLYTLRDFMTNLDDFEVMCQKISDIGFKAVQVSGTPLCANDIKPILDKYNLQVYTTHKAYNDFVNDIEGVIEYNKILGSSLCGLGMSPNYMCESLSGLKLTIKNLNKSAETIKNAGLTFGLHNHAIEFAKVDGKMVYEYLLEETDPDAFHFIVDTYWLQVGGLVPQDTIRRLGKRAEAVHFKDYIVNPKDWKHPLYGEVGNGNLDWDAIIQVCEEAGSKYVLIEQDTCPSDPFDSLKQSYDFLKTKGFN